LRARLQTIMRLMMVERSEIVGAVAR